MAQFGIVENMVLIKVIRNSKGNLISICDKGALGKIYRDQTYCLDLIKYRKFYEGESLDSFEDVGSLLKNASSINAVGSKSINLLKKYGFDTTNAKKIGKEEMKHLQIYRI